MYNIIGKKKIFLSISGVFCGISILSLIIFGLKPGIDFTGGTMMEVKFKEKTLTNQEIKDNLKEFDLGEIVIQRTDDEHSVILRFSAKGGSASGGKEVNEEIHQKILEKLGRPEETRFEAIGPTIGQELTNKAKWAIVLINLAILIYIVWAFRKLSKIIKKGESWFYGGGAIAALIHDVLIILGLFAILGRFRNFEINSGFITAILTVIGYSVNDTIVVYDRIRENLLIHGWKDFTGLVNRSLNEILIRSLNTGVGALLTLLAIFFFGGETIRDFVLVMMVGIITGTWSSIAIATSFLFLKKRT